MHANLNDLTGTLAPPSEIIVDTPPMKEGFEFFDKLYDTSIVPFLETLKNAGKVRTGNYVLVFGWPTDQYPKLPDRLQRLMNKNHAGSALFPIKDTEFEQEGEMRVSMFTEYNPALIELGYDPDDNNLRGRNHQIWRVPVFFMEIKIR